MLLNTWQTTHDALQQHFISFHLLPKKATSHLKTWIFLVFNRRNKHKWKLSDRNVTVSVRSVYDIFCVLIQNYGHTTVGMNVLGSVLYLTDQQLHVSLTETLNWPQVCTEPEAWRKSSIFGYCWSSIWFLKEASLTKSLNVMIF